MDDIGQVCGLIGQVYGQVCVAANHCKTPILDRLDRFGQVFKRSIPHARHKRNGENPSKCVQMRPMCPAGDCA